MTLETKKLAPAEQLKLKTVRIISKHRKRPERLYFVLFVCWLQNLLLIAYYNCFRRFLFLLLKNYK